MLDRASIEPEILSACFRRSPIPECSARNVSRADRVIQFIELLCIPSGHGAGTLFKLREWQKEFIRDIYEPEREDGRRLVRKAVFSVPRKNGKTALIACIILCHLVGPEARINQEIYSAANDRDQAAQVFKFIAQMIEMNPELSDALEVVASKKRINCPATGTFYQALSSEAGTKHGYKPSVVVFDELAQAANRELFDVLETGQGAEEEPLFFTISTQSHDPQHPLSEMIDFGLSGEVPSIVCHLYECPDDVDIFDERYWFGANPALGDFRSYDEMAEYASRAAKLSSYEAKMRNLYLNQRVSLLATMFPRSTWMACSGEVVWHRGEEVYLGLDLAGTTDLAALSVLAADGTKTQTYFWKPRDLLAEHTRNDRFPYERFYKEGLINASAGRSILPEDIALRIATLHNYFEVKALAYDRWRFESLLVELRRIELDCQKGEGHGLRIEPFGQGYQSMAPAIEALEELVVTQTLVHNNHPVLNWNIANAIIDMDGAGNRKLDKGKSRLRIDGAVSLVMAAGMRAKDLLEAPAESYLERREMIIL